MGSKRILETKPSELEKLTPESLKSILKFIYESSEPKGTNKFSDEQLGWQKNIIKVFILNPTEHAIEEDDLNYLVTYLNQKDIEQMFPVKNLQENIAPYETAIKKFKSEQIHYLLQITQEQNHLHLIVKQLYLVQLIQQMVIDGDLVKVEFMDVRYL